MQNLNKQKKFKGLKYFLIIIFLMIFYYYFYYFQYFQNFSSFLNQLNTQIIFTFINRSSNLSFIIKVLQYTKLINKIQIKRQEPGMNSPLKNKIKKFSNHDQECVTKLSLLTRPQSGRVTNLAFLNTLLASQKYQQPLAYLDFKYYINISFDRIKQKHIIIKQSVLLENQIKGCLFVVMINTNIETNITMIQTVQTFEKKKSFSIAKSKAVPIRDYQKGDVKLIFTVKKCTTLANVRINLDTIKIQFEMKKIVNTISPKKQKQTIQEYIQLNRGRSSEILRQRSIARIATNRECFLKSASSFRSLDQTYRPITAQHTKRDISLFHQFQLQKDKYLKHMKKMCQQKDFLLKRTQSSYTSKKQQQLRNLTSWINMNKFICASRIKIMNLLSSRIKKVKIQMLVAQFCNIMKSKLRFKITQKARYRMAVKQPLAFLGDIFYRIQHPIAQNKVLECLKKIQIFKTGHVLCNKSIIYYQKTIVVQRYFRKKIANILQRVDVILDKLQEMHAIKKLSKNKREQIKKIYLKKCYNQVKSSWIVGIHQNRKILEEDLLKIAQEYIGKN